MLSFAERYRQARLYAAQVRVRKAMGDKYAHAKPGRGGFKLINRTTVHEKLDPSLAA